MDFIVFCRKFFFSANQVSYPTSNINVQISFIYSFRLQFNCLGNFFILKFMIENRLFLKLRLSQHCLFLNITLVFSLPVIKTSCKRTHILPYFTSIGNSKHVLLLPQTHWFSRRNVILRNRQCCKRRNFRKI